MNGNLIFTSKEVNFSKVEHFYRNEKHDQVKLEKVKVVHFIFEYIFRLSHESVAPLFQSDFMGCTSDNY